MGRCQYCGTDNRGVATYCSHCGGLLAASAPASNGAPTATPTPSVMPRHATGRLPANALLAGRYMIVKTAGQGGMAAVYQALDTRTNKIIALKEMSQDGLSPDDLREALASFEFEAATLKRLHHQNLPRVYDQFSDATHHYLVMDYIEGQTLEQRQAAAQGAALPEAEVMAWAAQLCSVLAYLHAQQPPIIFRDLKPANIMLTPAGQIKLIDFGIARVFAPGHARDTQVLGTPGFAPPEQYGKAQTDGRADIYALGCTLYQLLAGYDPATTPFALPPLHSRIPHVPPHLELAITRATQLDRDARFGTVEAFAQALLRPDALYFRSGEAARTVSEAVALCRRFPQEGADHLYSGRLAGWLHAWGARAAATAAAEAVATHADHAAGLAAYLAAPTGGRSGRWTAPARSQTRSYATRPQPAVYPTQPAQPTGAAARTATQPAAVALVEPRTISFGRLTAGQRGVMPLVIRGEHGATVRGTVIAAPAWLHPDRTTFDGASTLIQLTAETSMIATPGTQHGTVLISCDSQQIHVGTSVNVVAASGRAHSRKQQPGQAMPAATAHALPAKYTAAAPRRPALARRATSAALACGLSAWVLWALEVGITKTGFAPVMWPVALAMLLVTALAAIPGALAGAKTANWQQRLSTSVWGSLIGLVIALGSGTAPAIVGSVGRGMVAAGAARPPAVLLVPLLAGVGAMAGADLRISGSMRAIGRVMRRFSTFFSVVVAVILGAWGGVALGGQIFNGFFVPVGLAAGAVVGALVALRMNRLMRRSRGARLHP